MSGDYFMKINEANNTEQVMNEDYSIYELMEHGKNDQPLYSREKEFLLTLLNELMEAFPSEYCQVYNENFK